MRPSPVTLLKMVTNLPLLLISLPALALPVPFVAWFVSIVLKTIIQFVHQISTPTRIYITGGRSVICFVWLYSQSAEPRLAYCKFYISVWWINVSWKKNPIWFGLTCLFSLISPPHLHDLQTMHFSLLHIWHTLLFPVHLPRFLTTL